MSCWVNKVHFHPAGGQANKSTWLRFKDLGCPCWWDPIATTESLLLHDLSRTWKKVSLENGSKYPSLHIYIISIQLLKACFFDFTHTIVFESRSVFCVRYCKRILLGENLPIALSPMLWAIWTLLVSSALIPQWTQNVSLSQQHGWGQTTGGRPQQMEPSTVLKFHPPHSPAVVSVCVRTCVWGARQPFLTFRQQALAGDNVTQLNRWWHNYIWYCTVITCHLSMRMC